MTNSLSRLVLLAGIWLSLAAVSPAWAQFSGTISSVTDTVSTKTCTSFVINGTVMTLSPPDCLKTTAPVGTDPVFSLQLSAATLTQPATAVTGTQVIYVDVVADRDVPTTTPYTLTFSLCTTAHACTAVGGSWQFFRYSGLGGGGFTAGDAVTTGSYQFLFKRGLDTSPNDLRRMRVGQLNMVNSPLFEGAKTVKFELAGAQATAGAVAATLNGGLVTVGVDLDINGNVIPATPTGPVGASGCEFWGNPKSPGAGTGPCGGYEIPVGNCNFSSATNPAEPIAKAWLYVLEDYVTPWPRVGQSMRYAMARNHAFVFRFKTGPTGSIDFGTANSRPITFANDENASRGSFAPRFITLSETRCDFDYSKTVPEGVNNGCYKMMGGSDSLQASIWKPGTAPTPAAAFPACVLKPDTTYYLNLRYEDAGTWIYDPALQTFRWNLSNRGKISCGTEYCAQSQGFN